MKILITGATGVIGRRALVLLVRAGHDITAAGHSPHKNSGPENSGAKPIGVDLFDKQPLGRCVAGHEVVINLATHMPASSLAALFPGAWKENDRLRRIASVNVAEAAMAGGAQRLIQESFAPDGASLWLSGAVACALAANFEQEVTGRSQMGAHLSQRARRLASYRGGALAIPACRTSDA